MSEQTPFLRGADPSDMDLIFKWANDPDVRRNSFNQDKIAYEDHCRWFERILSEPNEQLFVLVDDDFPVGQVRLSISGDNAEISYSIAPDKRGMGYGKAVIELIKKKVYDEFPEIVSLSAKVKPSNKASMFCFLDNGFIETFREFKFDIREYKNRQ